MRFPIAGEDTPKVAPVAGRGALWAAGRDGAEWGRHGGIRGEVPVPELPEVETIARDLCRRGVPGHRIREVILGWPGVVGLAGRGSFIRGVLGRRILSIGRRAKYLVFALDSRDHLLAHLRMSGRIYLEPTGGKHGSTRLSLRLDDGRWLEFVDPRKFGRWILVSDAEKVLGRLGPEPLGKDFTESWFRRNLLARRRQLKPLLLDQAFLAGLGNIYVDEALWAAGLHPCRSSAGLSTGEVHALYRAIRSVLRQGIRHRGTSLGNGQPNFRSPDGRHGANRSHLHVFRRTGQPCPRCGGAVERIVVGQRGTHVCPACQIRPSSLPCASR